MKLASQATLLFIYLTGHCATHANGLKLPLVGRQGSVDAVTFQAIDNATGNAVPVDGSQKVRRGTLEKRQPSRPIINCPGDAPGAIWTEHFFHGSWCGRQTGQQYLIRCNDLVTPAGSNVYTGSCQPNEVCIDGVQRQGMQDRAAYCVSGINFVNLAMFSGATTRKLKAIPSDLTQTNDMAEVFLSEKGDSTKVFNTAHLKLEAQDANGNTLPGGLDECSNCASIGVQPWPQNTASFEITVTLYNLDDPPDLYFPLVSPN